MGVSCSQFSLVQSLDRLGRRGVGGDMRNDSKEILFQSFLRETIMSSSDVGRDVLSMMLSIQHCFCRPRRSPSSKVPPKGGFGDGVVQSLSKVSTPPL